MLNKLWSAGRLLDERRKTKDEGQTFVFRPSSFVTDRWLLSALQQLVVDTTARMEAYEYAAALAGVERFFWDSFCDSYLELIKGRLYDGDEAERGAALATAAHAFGVILKLLAPFMPHITEELHQRLFADGQGASIHLAAWPQPDGALRDEAAERAGAAIALIVGAVRRAKSAAKLSLGAPLAELRIACADDGLREMILASAADLRSVTRAGALAILPAGHGEDLGPGLAIDLRL
jgi:valyl-tRNA synthetase